MSGTLPLTYSGPLMVKRASSATTRYRTIISIPIPNVHFITVRVDSSMRDLSSLSLALASSGTRGPAIQVTTTIDHAYWAATP